MTTETADRYVSQTMPGKMRRQAINVWSVAVAIVLLWVLTIVAAPVALESGYLAFSSPVYKFFSFICHQMPERSLWIDGHPLAVCSRCFGVYFGLLTGFAVYPLWRTIEEIESLPRIWLFLSMVPIGIDWTLGVFGIWENTHLSRFITGGLFGFACATYIVPAIVEISRNYSEPRQLFLSFWQATYSASNSYLFLQMANSLTTARDKSKI